MNNAIIEAVSWTLVHSIWQAAVIATILALILPAIRRNGYVASIGSLIVLVVACGVTFALYHGWSPAQPALQSVAMNNVTSDIANGTEGLSEQPSSLPPSNTGSTEQSSGMVETAHENAHAHVTVQAQAETSPCLTRILANWQPWLVIGWLMGASVQLLRLLISWFRLHRIHRTSVSISTRPDLAQRFEALGAQLGLQRKIKWLLSQSIDVPIVSGVFRPIVVVPTSMITGMTPQQVDMILLHELAHVRRHDFLINLLQMLVEILLFFNPAVWWISKQIRIQREYRCDDVASSACADKNEYAWALAALEQLRESPAIAMAADGGQAGSLLDRVSRLVAPTKAKRRWLSGLTCFLFAVLTAAAIGFVSTRAVADRIQQMDGLTLHAAAVHFPDRIDGLISDGHLVNALDHNGATPLWFATMFQKHAAVEKLLAHNADPNVVLVRRDSPLTNAALWGNFDTVQLLVEHGADVNAQYNSGTALHRAIPFGRHDIVRLLLDHPDIDLNQREKGSDFTPLHIAVRHQRIKTITALLARNADPSIKDSVGNTPYDSASSKIKAVIAASYSDEKNSHEPNVKTPENISNEDPSPEAETIQKRNQEEETIRDYVMLQLRKFVIGSGKIESAKINMAIDVVSSEGSQFAEVRKLLLDALEKSHVDKNGNFPRKRILEVMGRMLAEDGQDRWSHEYSKRPGAAPQQAMILHGDSLYMKSPYVEKVMKLGRKATRSDIDNYVMAIRNAHHPQTIEFLLDVINEPTDSGSPFAEPAEKPIERPGDVPTGSDPADSVRAAGKEKWSDNSGGGWEDAKLIAAIGLAELGRAEGVEWLIEKTRPNDFGINYKLRPMCIRSLQGLTRGQLSDKGVDDWPAWWQENKDRFTPNRVFGIGTSINSQPFRSFQMSLADPIQNTKPASSNETDSSWNPPHRDIGP